ncbi:MAG: hypothetical protein AAGC74_08495 [Verrucomicrobiota bacterium]
MAGNKSSLARFERRSLDELAVRLGGRTRPYRNRRKLFITSVALFFGVECLVGVVFWNSEWLSSDELQFVEAPRQIELAIEFGENSEFLRVSSENLGSHRLNSEPIEKVFRLIRADFENRKPNDGSLQRTPEFKEKQNEVAVNKSQFLECPVNFISANELEVHSAQVGTESLVPDQAKSQDATLKTDSKLEESSRSPADVSSGEVIQEQEANEWEVGRFLESSEVPLPEGDEDIGSGSESVLPNVSDLEENSSLSGVVFGDDGQGLPGVIVSIPAIGRTTRSQQDGTFTLESLPSTELVVKFNKFGYFESDRVVVLKVDKVLEIRQSLEERPVELVDEEYELDEVEVVGEFEEERSNEIVFEEFADFGVKGIVGQADFAKKNLGDVAEAVEKIAGANIVGDGRAVVRGLADRYITTQFNNSPIATTSPFRKAVSLDLFPTVGVDAIVVDKVYNATLPGDFGGASIRILSRSFPEEQKLELKTEFGFDEINAGDDFLVNDGEGLDFFGNADFADFNDSFLNDEGSLVERSIGAIRSRSFLPRSVSQEFDQTYTLSIGDSFEFGSDGQLGFIYSLRRGQEDSVELDSFLDTVTSGNFTADRYVRQTDWTHSLGIGLRLNTSHELNASFFKRFEGRDRVAINSSLFGGFGLPDEPEVSTTGSFFQNADNNAVEFVGLNVVSTQLRENRYDIFQISGRHALFGDDLDDANIPLLEWELSRSENEIDIEGSAFRRLEFDFGSDAVLEAASAIASGFTREAYSVTPEFFSTVRTDAQFRSTFVLTGGFTDQFVPTRTLTAAEFDSLNTWSELESALENANASDAAINAYNGSFETQFLSDASDLPTDPERGREFTIEDGASPSDIDSFRERFLQFERVENFRTDLTFPLLGRGGSGSSLVLRTGLARENRLRLESNREITLQIIGTSDIDGFGVGTNPDEGIPAELALGEESGLELIASVGNDGARIVRDGEVSQTTTSLYADFEFDWEPFLLRVGARREFVSRRIIVPGVSDSGDFGESVDLFGASARYEAGNGLMLIAAISNTVARPITKELLPFPQINRETGEVIVGDSDLEDSSILNFDFTTRFPDVMGIETTLNLFHKVISDPIVRLREGNQTQVTNGNEATVAGFELEGIVELPYGLGLDFNYAFIEGSLTAISLFDVTQGPLEIESSLPEQPKHIFNVGLSYSSEEMGVDANLGLNFVGSYLEAIPATPTDRFLERQPSPQLDFVFKKTFSTDFADYQLGLAIDNILASDEEVLFVPQDGSEATQRAFIEGGRRFSVWVKGAF